ncbi:MAG: 3-keto-5-aminohexanoate cleavage protein [Deltaproteobacteria bacterium]|nr:MAG: 3-keto-5-aminohexanoate cleavage protein [Deltaproteobacteria bacterium]
MSAPGKVIVTCALTGVLTDPEKFDVPVTPAQMAQAAQEAYDAGATIVHCHFRDQNPGMGRFPTWELETVGEILAAIQARVPGIVINMSSAVLGPDISAPCACIEAFEPEMAACNAGSINYLKTRKDGRWAWPPVLFDNPVEKVKGYLDVMQANGVIPEFECFDTGMVRSVGLYRENGMFSGDPHISLVMGVPSGMPARTDLLPILVDEMPPNTHWQVIAIGRQEVWPLHRRAAELGGNVRTGLEDTFYLPDGRKAKNNGELVEALVTIVRETGREIATLEETRRWLDQSRMPPATPEA